MQGMFPRRWWSYALIPGLVAVFGLGCAAPNSAPDTAQVSRLATPPPAATVVTPSPAPATAPPAPSPTVIPPTVIPPTASPTLAPPTALPPTATAPLPTAEPAPQPIDPALAGELQGILDALVADGQIPGAVLAVHIPGYAPWAGASGVLDRQQGLPMTPATRVRIASISKVFTAVVVLQLVEEGRLDLDAPLAAWMPSLVPGADGITVRRLLNHTTGLYDYLEDRDFLGKAYQAPSYRWLPAELVAYAAHKGALFRPGAPGAWDYSSTNYVILGMLVEQVTGRPLAQEMRERIFAPLGLEQTAFVPDEEVFGVQARGYRAGHDVTDVSLSFAFATANLVSTASDVQRFGQALFGGELLRPDTMELMLTFEDGKGQYNMPALEYGLGVMRNRLPVGPDAAGQLRPQALSTVLGHTGGFGGFRSVLWHAPESGVTIALGENQGATDPNILATSVLDAILRAQGR